MSFLTSREEGDAAELVSLLDTGTLLASAIGDKGKNDSSNEGNSGHPLHVAFLLGISLLADASGEVNAANGECSGEEWNKEVFHGCVRGRKCG